jgi:hypothetical protein
MPEIPDGRKTGIEEVPRIRFTVPYPAIEARLRYRIDDVGTWVQPGIHGGEDVRVRINEPGKNRRCSEIDRSDVRRLAPKFGKRPDGLDPIVDHENRLTGAIRQLSDIQKASRHDDGARRRARLRPAARGRRHGNDGSHDGGSQKRGEPVTAPTRPPVTAPKPRHR